MSIKQELIEAIRSILDANEKNKYCDEHQLADMITEVIHNTDVGKDYDIDQTEISEGC